VQSSPKGDSGYGAGCCFYSCDATGVWTYKADSAAIDEASCAKISSSSCITDAMDTTEGNTQFVFGCDCSDVCAPSWWPSTS
jgi:hypothetical protein